MSILEHRIASLTEVSANLLAEFSELNRLRERVRKAQWAALKSVRPMKGQRPRPPAAELRRDSVKPLRQRAQKGGRRYARSYAVEKAREKAPA